MTSVGPASAIVITPSVLASSLVSGLTADQAGLASLEQQISTGDAISVASDDPAGAANLLQLQGSVARAHQYSANAADGLGWLSLGNSTVGSILGVLQQVQSAVRSVSGSSLTGDPTVIESIATQVTSATEQLLNLANTQYAGGQAIFAGTGNPTQAYDPNGTYLGAGSAPTRTVAPGTQVPVAVTGPQVFGTGSSGLLGPGGVLAQIVQDLKTGTAASIQNVETTDLAALGTAIGQVESAAAVLGANQQAVEGFSEQATSTTSSLEQELGSVQGVNLAQAITNLKLQQTAYQAALYATSQLSAASLVKYL